MGDTAIELRAAAERAVTELRIALVEHASTMAVPGSRPAEIADADHKVIAALNIYRDFAEAATGLAVLPHVPTIVSRTDDGGTADWCNDIDDPTPSSDQLLLTVRWRFTVMDRDRLIAAGTKASGEGDLEGRSVGWALSSLFENEVSWPPTEYRQSAGLDIESMTSEVTDEPERDET